MTGKELLVLGSGGALLAFFSIFHLYGLRLIRWCTPKQRRNPYMGIVLTFWGLAVIHLTEIIIGALLLRFLLWLPGTGRLVTHSTTTTMADLLYLSGVSFTTLGYTAIEAHGPIRLLIMLLALGGFMLITWSATFIYRLWGNSFLD